MPAALVISPNPNQADEISEMTQKGGYRTRIVSNIENAEQWLSMINYDVLLVDALFEKQVITKLFDSAWKLNPSTYCAAFSYSQTIPFKWDLALEGANFFEAPNTKEDLERAIKHLAENRSDWSNFPILLVEDLDSPREIISAYVESMGYNRVDGAKNGREAIETLRDKPYAYSCVITDINMPEMNGHELISEIRRDSEIHHIPVIVLTAYASTENLLECIKAGATGFLVKPPKKKELRKELEKARRILFNRQSPRLCGPEDSIALEEALLKKGSL